MIQESVPYENCMELIEGMPLPPADDPRAQKMTEERDYPITLRVHLVERKDADDLAKALGIDLSGDELKVVFDRNAPRKANASFADTPKKTRKSADKTDRIEETLWGKTTDYENEEIAPFASFTFTLNNVKDHGEFLKRIKQQLSFETKSTYFPAIEKQVRKGKAWVSKFDNHQPRYPVFIVSKGRAYSRVTASTLERLGVPFRIIIEPQDWDDYRAFFTSDQLIVAPFSNHGDGPGRARNYAWDIAIAEGHAAHWVMDDNIKDFYRLHKNERLRFGDGGCFRAMEDFFDRFENLYIAGPQYRFFCAPKQGYPQSVLNTRIYSCLLIRNDCKHRWRGRYNEDTDLSLRVLKDGDCTLQWNEFLQEKMATQALTGGNTTEFYHAEHLGEVDPKLGTYNVGGTFKKSAMLKQMHPDETQLVCKYGRWHHEVNYDKFKANKLRFKAGMETSDRTYPFELIERHS